MSDLARLRVQNVRTHSDYTLDLSSGVTLITGKNGSGKTSLLEALYISLQGTSFKTSDGDVLQYDKDWWRIDVLFQNETKRAVKYDPSRVSGKKQFVVDEKTAYRLSPKHKYPVVLFEPDDLRLLHGSPSRRRQFIDRFISQLEPVYGTILRKYERALKQRNNLLKQPGVTSDDLFVWNMSLSEYGATIIEQRIRFIERINAQLNETYNAIAHSNDTVGVHYSHTLVGALQQKLLNELHANSQRDIYLGYTSIGPHRHDVLFTFNDNLALTVASRGEVRSMVLALKFIEVDIIRQLTDKKPLILLDDVFSELDESRQAALMENTKDCQMVIATTNNQAAINESVLRVTLGGVE